MSDISNNNEDMSVEVVTFQDDDGNEFDMEIVEEFEHAGRKFAVLAEVNEDGCGCSDSACNSCSCGCGAADDPDAEVDAEEDEEDGEALYIFEVVDGADGEEFVPVDDDNLLDELSAVVENLLFTED